MKRRNNKKQWNKWMAGALCFWLLLAALPVHTAQAASATLTLSTEMEEIHAGDTVEVELTIRADATIGDFEAFLSYDDTIFEFYSAASCITGGAGFLKVADIGASPSQQDRTYRIFFKALVQGECEISLVDRPIVYGYTDGLEMSVTGFSKTFSVLPAADASDNNLLSALHIVDNKARSVVLSPEFSPETEEYQAEVPVSSELLIVSAIAEDEMADVEINGGKTLELGENEVSVTVTAENGGKRIYKIHVFRSEEEEKKEEQDIVPEPPQITLTPGIVLEETEEQVLVTEYHTYTVWEKPAEFVLPDGYMQTTLMLQGVQVAAYAKQGASAEEFLLLVLKNEAGDVNWYRYDRVEQTLQRVNEEEYIVTQVVQSNDAELKEALQQYKVQQVALIFAVALLFGVCLVLLVAILWLCIRRRNRGQTE
ncbi:MAG: cadherin-like beta sandwich domain-containing protein [Lachnospiraceae bacterium]|nr:cadherin-like beta sandwich domain-containing protein [Lachnospiraceae bacterium]